MRLGNAPRISIVLPSFNLLLDKCIFTSCLRLPNQLGRSQRDPFNFRLLKIGGGEQTESSHSSVPTSEDPSASTERDWSAGSFSIAAQNTLYLFSVAPFDVTLNFLS